MESRKTFFLIIALSLLSRMVWADSQLIVGHYSAERMASIKPLTLPRLHLYDENGKLIDRAAWPKALAPLKVAAGEAYCCVSADASPSGGKEPPKNCKKVIYGEHLLEHFKGLLDGNGRPIEYSALATHKYLFVEYYADWCAPCVPARHAMESFLSSPDGQGYTAVVVDFSELIAK